MGGRSVILVPPLVKILCTFLYIALIRFSSNILSAPTNFVILYLSNWTHYMNIHMRKEGGGGGGPLLPPFSPPSPPPRKFLTTCKVSAHSYIALKSYWYLKKMIKCNDITMRRCLGKRWGKAPEGGGWRCVPHERGWCPLSGEGWRHTCHPYACCCWCPNLHWFPMEKSIIFVRGALALPPPWKMLQGLKTSH